MAQIFSSFPTKLKLLILADVDSFTAGSIAEKYVPSCPYFDGILVCGPFTQSDANTPEAVAAAQGDMAAIIASLENVVCRVLYLPAETDPARTLTEQLYLTPNSVNIFARKLELAQGLAISGFTEKSGSLQISKIPDSVDRSAESDDDLDSVEVHSSNIRTENIIDEILLADIDPSNNFDKVTLQRIQETSIERNDLQTIENRPDINFNIFVFNYKYAHSLSHFLFHSASVVEKARVKLCVIPSVSSSNADASRLPKSFGGLSIAVPKSLRTTGEYLVAHLELSADGTWRIAEIEERKL